MNNASRSSFDPSAGSLKIVFQTLGCKVNRYETDAVRQAFEKRGFIVLSESDAKKADVFVINTCTVTAEADRKSRQMIRRARRRNPGVLVVAMGCQVELQKSASEADISVGTKNRLSVVDRVAEMIEKRRTSDGAQTGKAPEAPEQPKAPEAPEAGKAPEAPEQDLLQDHVYQEFGPVLSQEDTRAYIKIEDGCDSFCSYCIIPFARGRVVSRDAGEILKEARELGDRGFHEIVLSGIHICSYGKDRGEDISALGKLLSELESIPSISRIRLGSLEPNSMNEEFISKISGLSKICPHFHISLQSGSDTVLSRMNRKYDTAKYRQVLCLLRRYFQSPAITTDIIVAFPAETTQEHEESLAFCKEMGFSRIHVFPYSERAGTKAASMMPKIQNKTAEKRRDDFLCLSRNLKEKYCAAFVGAETEVLLETIDANNSYVGYTKQYIRVHIDPQNVFTQGMEARVRIESFLDGELMGRITSK